MKKNCLTNSPRLLSFLVIDFEDFLVIMCTMLSSGTVLTGSLWLGLGMVVTKLRQSLGIIMFWLRQTEAGNDNDPVEMCL